MFGLRAGSKLVQSTLLRPKPVSTASVRLYRHRDTDLDSNNKKAAKLSRSKSGQSHLQVLGTGGGELTPCFYLFTTSKRYLFNCSENTLRFCFEHLVNVGRVEDVFLTRLSWENLAGLPGLALTMRDWKIENSPTSVRPPVVNLNLHGPESLSNFARVFSFMIGSAVGKTLMVSTPNCARYDPTPSVFSDENISITTLEMFLDTEQDRTRYDLFDGGEPPRHSARWKQKVKSTVAFICKLCDVPGKFNPEKAQALGLPPGLLYRKLVDGCSVTTPHGKVIHPSDVMAPTERGPSFAVVECTDLKFVSAVVSHPRLQSHKFEAPLDLFVHIVTPEVLKNEQYCRWMASFGDKTKHLLLGKGVCEEEVSLRSSLKVQCPLHLLNPEQYHLPFVDATSDTTSKSCHHRIHDFLPKESVIFGQPAMKFILKPLKSFGCDLTSVKSPLKDDISKHLLEAKSNLPFLAKRDAKSIGHSNKDGFFVTFLGTAASNPSRFRNVSGILLQWTPEHFNVLLDCGDGTLSQIYRCFGKEKGDDIITNLQAVFISHHHCDHNLGLLSILERRSKLFGGSARTRVLGPTAVGKWLKEYKRTCENADFLFYDCANFADSLSAVHFQTVPVIHCRDAYGMVLHYPAGLKVVYSGDTRPCEALVEAGSNASLLIHEATYDDAELEMALERHHSTAGEALKVAKRMNAEFCLFTHFSHRYSAGPPAILKSEQRNIGLAFDCMTVGLEDLKDLSSSLPAIREIFATGEEGEGEGEIEACFSWEK